MFNAILKNPTNVKFESQEDDEIIYYVLRRHPIVTVWWILTSIFFLLLPILIYIFRDTPIIPQSWLLIIPIQYWLILLILWYMVVIFLAFEAFLLWYFNIYILTDRRIVDIDFHGLWKKRISEASLANVEDATYSTDNMLNIVFDYGDVYIQTAAEKPEFEFKAIPKPGEVHDKLTDLAEAYKRKYGR